MSFFCTSSITIRRRKRQNDKSVLKHKDREKKRNRMKKMEKKLTVEITVCRLSACCRSSCTRNLTSARHLSLDVNTNPYWS